MNLYPIIDERPKRRFLDWRFFAALTVLILVGFFVWAGFRNYEIREAEAAQKDILIDQLADRSATIRGLQGEVADLTDRVAVLQDRAREDREQAASERRRGNRERARLIRQQTRMIALLRRVNITYMSGDTRVTSPPAAPARRDAAPSRTTSSGGTSTRPSTRTAPKPAPPTAGKSGKTPKGKARGLRR